LVPDDVFFTHLAARRFPVTVWLREPHEFDYIVEPDLFHDFFGHVPLLFDSVFADHLQAYGAGGLKALTLDGLPFLARLYWYTMEFGLIATPDGLRAYGAGLLSSAGEIAYCLESSWPLRLQFDVQRVMRTLYKIDSYQQSYFVIDGFEQLFADTSCDFAPLYAALKPKQPFRADSLQPGDALHASSHCTQRLTKGTVS
ncbi:MAG: phenylalanine 4-monooxygenase, partial [Herminiimonas sp.]|nr:phenylalanine 4-monooxygenase [Herminiimonas sp.]